MNTPGHAIVNLVLLGRDRALTAAIVLGAIAPDVPLFLFYFWERLVLGVPERIIWGSLYFEPRWQLVFDLAHSLPFAAAGYVLARRRDAPRAAAFCASAFLHGLLDLPLHHDDAHRHFLPLSGWRFASPLSYWDPQHHGGTMAALEATVAVVGTAIVWPRVGGLGRGALAGAVALYATAYWGFYFGGWDWG